jgi:hypothetical protein
MAKDIGPSGDFITTWASSGNKNEAPTAEHETGAVQGIANSSYYNNEMYKLSTSINYGFRKGVVEWGGAKTYSIGDVVEHNQALWIAIAASSNSEPTGLNSNWQKVIQAEDPSSLISWDNAGTTFTADNVQGAIFESATRILAVETDNAGQGTVILSNTSRIDAIEIVNTTQDGNISSNTSRITTAEGRLDAVETVNTTQDGNITNNSNRLTVIEQKPYFFGSGSVVSSGASVDSLVPFTPAESRDINSVASGSGSLLTVTEDGVYSINVTLDFAYTSVGESANIGRIYYNGAQALENRSVNAIPSLTVATDQVTITYLKAMVNGDTISVSGFNNSTSSTITGVANMFKVAEL